MTEAEWKEAISRAMLRGDLRSASPVRKVDPKLDRRARALARKAKTLLETLADDDLGAIDRAAALSELYDVHLEIELCRDAIRKTSTSNG